MDGRLLDLGRPKQRAVPVELLIHANRVVSLNRFAEILWPGGVGERSTRSLPVYIANLRRLVEPERPARTPPERLLTRVPGYLLHVGPGEYDAADFERLASEGNGDLAGGRPQAARRVLGRGPGPVAGPRPGGVRLRRDGGRSTRGSADRGHRRPDRGRPRPRGPHRGRRRAGGARAPVRAAGAARGPADAGPLSLRPPERGLAGVHGGAGPLGRRARS